MSKYEKIAEAQARYYGDLFTEHGTGVDAVASSKQVYKNLRYSKLCQVFKDDTEFSLHDIGFGIGHFYEYLKNNFTDKNIKYSGSEVTESFVSHCRKSFPQIDFFHRDITEQAYKDTYDYIVFAGTFYQKADISDNEFTKFIERILSNSFQMVNKGIAFNLVTEHVDYRYPELFYGEIDKISRFIVNNLSRYFTIDHASPLYEMTVFVYKEEYIKLKYTEKEFLKYYKT